MLPKPIGVQTQADGLPTAATPLDGSMPQLCRCCAGSCAAQRAVLCDARPLQASQDVLTGCSGLLCTPVHPSMPALTPGPQMAGAAKPQPARHVAPQAVAAQQQPAARAQRGSVLSSAQVDEFRDRGAPLGLCCRAAQPSLAQAHTPAALRRLSGAARLHQPAGGAGHEGAWGGAGAGL